VVDAGPSGRCTPTIDGTIGADWTAEAILATNAAPTGWGAGLNELRSVRVCYDATNLYLGIDGEDEAANAIVLYLDRDDGSSTGINTPTGFRDNTGALDDAISAAFSSFPGGLGIDWAWGTRGRASATTGA